MDVANGGYRAFGGYHRLFGGHSIVDLDMWSRFGPRFALELGKDSLTTAGLPLPGVQTAVLTKKWISASFAQKWMTINAGKFLGIGAAAIDSAISISKLRHDLVTPAHVAVKGGIKIAAGLSFGNIPLVAVGIADLGIAGMSHIEKQMPTYEHDSEMFPWVI